MTGIERLPIALWVALGAYLVGSVNISIIASRLLGLGDLLRTGSGNPGATNLLRAAGPAVAVPVLLLDFLKAFGVVWAATLLDLEPLAPAMALPLLVGNIFPVFHRFKGGKGVAAAVGAFLAVDPLVVLLGGGVFLIAVAVSRRVSAGSILMIVSYSCWILLFEGGRVAFVTSGVVAGIVLVTHRSNMVRLLRGEEPKLGAPRASKR